MTLADLIRQYFEDRRNKFFRKLEWSVERNNFHFLQPLEENYEPVLNEHRLFFSNNIDPKKDRSNGFPQTRIIRQIGVSRSQRVINLPDGSIRTETIIRDSQGNEEKYVTTQKGDQKHTVVIRKDASGAEHSEEKINNAKEPENFGLEGLLPPPSQPDFQHGIDSGYDFWFRKFFDPENEHQNNNVSKSENSPFEFGVKPDEQIENILKKFTGGRPFGPFPEEFKNNNLSRDEDIFGEIPKVNDFPRFNNSLFDEESRKLMDENSSFVEKFEKSTANSPTYSRKKKNNPSQKHMERMLRNITSPLSSSMFDQFAENAMIEIPEEKSPLDQFVKMDEDAMKKLREIRRRDGTILKRLDNYFSLALDKKENNVPTEIVDANNKNDIVNLPLVFPKPESRSVSNDLGDLVRKAFDGNLFYGSSQTRMLIENGKKRIESIKKNDNGVTQKIISYEIGNRCYSVTIVTDKFGKQIKRDRNFNFSEEELPNFKNQWSKNFHSDFEE